jgi:hypothetical protein
VNLNDHKSYISKHQILSSYNLFEHVNFFVERETDFPKVYIEPKVARNFILRNINWPNFMNISALDAKNHLNEKSQGSHLFRPSAKSISSLTLSWKMFDDIIINYEIDEGYRRPTQEISPDLTFESHMYNTLQEIEEGALAVLNKLATSVTSNAHFCPVFTQVKKDQLLIEQRSKPYKLIYCLRLSMEKPRFIILSYIDENMDFIDELIEFSLTGFKFHDQTFENIFSLSGWFKSNWKTKQYKQFLKENKNMLLNNYLVIDDLSSTASHEDGKRAFLGKRERSGYNDSEDPGKKFKTEGTTGRKEEYATSTERNNNHGAPKKDSWGGGGSGATNDAQKSSSWQNQDSHGAGNWQNDAPAPGNDGPTSSWGNNDGKPKEAPKPAPAPVASWGETTGGNNGQSSSWGNNDPKPQAVTAPAPS